MLVDSRRVAEYFGREHKSVTRAIENIVSDESGYSKDFRRRNFAPTSYTDEWNRKQPAYLMTRDGFTALAMGFTGKKAAQFKEAYIKRFNEMEMQLASLQHMREQHPMLTEAINAAHEDPQPYHYSNEADMINRIVLGMTAKQFREAHKLEKGDPIRPHMTPMQSELMNRLQTIDVGLVIAVPDFQQRKMILAYHAEEYRNKCELALESAE